MEFQDEDFVIKLVASREADIESELEISTRYPDKYGAMKWNTAKLKGEKAITLYNFMKANITGCD
jgi:hypothetical protein